MEGRDHVVVAVGHRREPGGIVMARAQRFCAELGQGDPAHDRGQRAAPGDPVEVPPPLVASRRGRSVVLRLGYDILTYFCHEPPTSSVSPRISAQSAFSCARRAAS